MRQVGISEISRNPAIFNNDELLEIVDKKSKKSKYIAIPSRYEAMIQKLIEDIEYTEWLEKNRNALENGENWGELLEEAADTVLEKP